MVDIFGVCSLFMTGYEKKIGGHLFVSSEIEVENYSFFASFCTCFNGKSTGSPHQTVAAKKKTVPRIFFKNRQNLPDTFLLEMRKKKKMGVAGLVFAQRTKLSPTVIDTVAKRPK